MRCVLCVAAGGALLPSRDVVDAAASVVARRTRDESFLGYVSSVPQGTGTSPRRGAPRRRSRRSWGRCRSRTGRSTCAGQRRSCSPDEGTAPAGASWGTFTPCVVGGVAGGQVLAAAAATPTPSWSRAAADASWKRFSCRWLLLGVNRANARALHHRRPLRWGGECGAQRRHRAPARPPPPATTCIAALACIRSLRQQPSPDARDKASGSVRVRCVGDSDKCCCKQRCNLVVMVIHDRRRRQSRCVLRSAACIS